MVPSIGTRIVAAVLLLSLIPATARGEEEDPLPRRSIWTGNVKLFESASANRIVTKGAEIRIHERNGNDVRAEMMLDNRKLVFAMEGRVTPESPDNVTLRATKTLKGNLPPEALGRTPMVGYARNGAMKLKCLYGELELKLKK